ncbi:C-type lectin domain family 10 member A [Triplophysa tibetana]|uniref:C-type lectin domain family 10 member A n=1 Tax=Triplophysa tibetana TaxID=1572043 RepID=A0A5A9N1L2_9TELE|nr:C-type lectin domain family 10 member A [Triplophysa tibetana]
MMSRNIVGKRNIPGMHATDIEDCGDMNIYENVEDINSHDVCRGTEDTTRNQSSQLIDGWIYYRSSIYFFSSEKKSWTESRSYCTQRGADLIIINKKEEQEFVCKMSGEETVWIGLSDSDVEGTWKWVDGSTPISGFSLASWTSRPFTPRHLTPCIQFSVRWSNSPCVDPPLSSVSSCDFFVIVLCVLIYTNNHQLNNINNKNIPEERDKLLTNNIKVTEERDQLLTNNIKVTEERDQLLTKYTNITKERDQLLTKYTNITKEREQINEQIHKLWKILNVTDGWLYKQPSFYFISSEKKSWSESRRFCREKKSDLIIIDKKEEQEFAVKATDDYGVWIGLSDSDEEGRWKWVDGSTLTSGGVRRHSGKVFTVLGFGETNDGRQRMLDTVSWMYDKTVGRRQSPTACHGNGTCFTMPHYNTLMQKATD